MPGGRPSDYTPEIADKICSQISDGKSLRTICKAASMPSVVTIFSWLRKHPEFVKQYETAKQEQSDMLVEEMLDISDDSASDYISTEHGEKINTEHVQRSRLRVDTRKWIASKLKPKKYGEKQEVEHSGSLSLIELIKQSTQAST